MIRIEIVAKERIAEIWPQIEEWVKSALGNDKSYTTDDVKEACLTRMNLVLIYAPELTGFMIFQIYPAPQCKCCYAPWLGGKDLALWVEQAMQQFKAFLRGQEVKQYGFVGRKAWGKLLQANSEQSFYLVSLT